MPEEVFVEHIDHGEFGLGEIHEVTYGTGHPLVSVEWPNGNRGQYWVEELEFIVGKK